MKQFAAILFVGIILFSCSDPVSKEQHKPVINSIAFDRSQIYVKEFITIQASVSDKDDDPIKYTWTADGGDFTSTKNNPTQWHASAQAGTFTITLNASDGNLSTEKSKQIKVISN
jgi:PKD repeat protein